MLDSLLGNKGTRQCRLRFVAAARTAPCRVASALCGSPALRWGEGRVAASVRRRGQAVLRIDGYGRPRRQLVPRPGRVRVRRK